ncbi:Non-specific serine/threonine protein kinase [Bertholletia excelsa]
MPSRQSPAPLTPAFHGQQSDGGLLFPVAAGGGVACAFSFLMLIAVCFPKLRKRTVPSDSKPPYRFPYSALRSATASFSASRRLGQGGFGSVYRGSICNPSREVAVKVMDAGSLQGEREFQNELFFGGRIDSKYICSVIGFSSDRKRRRMLLVYELMSNGSLQDCLLHRKCVELMEWDKRFRVAIEIAKGLEYLHHCCDPPVIHGDIKPSNILLDVNFSAKIGDFGLAMLKPEGQCQVAVIDGGLEGKKELEANGREGGEENGSAAEETESVTTTGFDEFNVGINQSPDSFLRVTLTETSPSPEMVMGAGESPEAVAGAVASPETSEAPMLSPRATLMARSEGLEKLSVSERNFEAEMVNGRGVIQSDKSMKCRSVKDWWWKQDNGGAESGVVKDYVMEWIGSEIKQERPKTEWIGASSSTSGPTGKLGRKKNRRKLDWWMTMDEDKDVKKEKRRPAREWWKEEYCDELEREKKKKKKKRNKGKGQ